MKIHILALGLITLAPLCAGEGRPPIRHDFLAIDEGLSNLMRVDETNPAHNWLVHIGHEHPRDMQLEGGNRLLISHDSGYCEYDIATGARLKDVTSFHDVSTARRLANGHLLLAGVEITEPKRNKGDMPLGDPAGKHVEFVEYDEAGKEVSRTWYTGDYLRLIRETEQGTYLCACNTEFKEADGHGHWIHEYPFPGFQHAWMALRLPDGTMYMSSGYGTAVPTRPWSTAFMVELPPKGKARWFGAAGQVPRKVHPYFYGMFQVLANGDLVVANWQGHRAGHNNEGEQLIEFNRQGRIVWTWNDRAFVSSLQNVLVLDGLDTAVINDEHRGVMGPARD
jgi:hypothetical protein